MNDEDLRVVVVAFLQERKPKRGKCYRCWQVGRESKATCVVLYNAGTDHEWKAVSCEVCARKDVESGIGPCKVIAEPALRR